MPDAFIYDHVRTPRGRGKADGALHEVTALNLATQALAGAADAYASARLAGHPVIGLIVGRAMSGALRLSSSQPRRILTVTGSGVAFTTASISASAWSGTRISADPA